MPGELQGGAKGREHKDARARTIERLGNLYQGPGAETPRGGGPSFESATSVPEGPAPNGFAGASGVDPAIVKQQAIDAAKGIGGEAGNSAMTWGVDAPLKGVSTVIGSTLGASAQGTFDTLAGAGEAALRAKLGSLLGPSAPAAPGAPPGPPGAPIVPQGPGLPGDGSVDPSTLAAGPTGPAGAPMPMGMPTGGAGGAPRMREVDLLGPQQRAAVEQARQSQEQYAATGGQPYAEQLGHEEAFANQQMAAAEARARVEEQRAAEQRQELEERQKDFDQAADSLKHETIDPGQAWGSKSDAAKAGAIGSILLGGLGSALAGGPNVGLQLLQADIDRSIDAQKFAYNAKKDSLSAKQTAFGQAMNRFGDERAATAVARASMREAQLAQMGKLAAQSKNVDVQDRFAQLSAQAQEQRAKDALQFLKFAPVGGGPGAMRLPDLDEKQLVTGPDGQHYYMPEADKYRAKDAAAQDIQASINEALQIRAGASKFDLLNPMSEARKRLDAIASDVDTKRTVYAGQGAMSKGDQEVSRQAVGSMTSIWGTNDKVLQATSAHFDRERANALKAGNAQQVQIVTTADPRTGMAVRKVIPSGSTYAGPAKPPPMPGSFRPAQAPPAKR